MIGQEFKGFSGSMQAFTFGYWLNSGKIGAEGGSRTRTPGRHHPLKMARLPVPPLRHSSVKD